MDGSEATERRVSGDTVLRAFLFTDLVGSTALTAQLGVEAAERFRRDHFAMLAHQIERHGGDEIKSVGDGVMATFPSVHRALDAAVAMQVSMYRTEPVGGITPSMRIGISAGDAVPHRGDYYGLTVNEAARLCAMAEGGEILVDAVVATIGGPTDHRFDPRGLAELRGLPQPVEVYEVWWPRAGVRLDLPLPGRIEAGRTIRFVGRSDAHRLVTEAVDQARAGRRRVVVIGGEPGIGKTTLVARALRTAADDADLAVLYGACDEDLVRPYGPFVDAFGHLAVHASDELLDALGDDIPGELLRLVPALADRLGLPLPAGRDPDAERAALFSAVVELLGRLGRRLPVVIVLDDLHWADLATLALFRHLARVDADLPLTLVATYRSTEVDAAHPLQDTLAVLARLTGVVTTDLGGLDDPEVCDLVAATAGHELTGDEVDVALRIGREAAGNPFFIVEILRDLVERGLVQRDPDGRWRAGAGWLTDLPRTVRDVIVQRVERLGPPTPAVLAAAAVLGLTFSPEVVAEALDVDLDTVVDGLDRAAAAALIDDSAEADGQLTFSHGLVQRTLYDNLGRLRRRRLHHRAAVALAARPAGSVPAAEVARHWSVAAGLDPVAALAAVVRAGHEALDTLAPDAAVDWFERARELVDGGAVDPAERGPVLLALGVAQRQAGRPAFRDTLLAAAGEASARGDHELLVSAALANSRGIQSTTGHSDEERIAVLARALEVTGADRPGPRAQLLALMALERLHVAPFAERRALADEALALARRSGDDAIVARVLVLRHNAIRVPDTVEERLADTAEALRLSERSDDLLTRFWAAEHRARVCSEAADLEEVDRLLARCRALADRLAQPGLRYYLAMHDAWRALLAGDLAASEAAASACLAIGVETGQHEARSMYVLQLLAVRREQGRQDELADVLRQAMAANGLAALRSSVALLDASAGRLDQAGETFRLDADQHFTAVPRNTLWSSAMVQCAEVCALLGDRRAAADLVSALSPYIGQLAHNSATCAGTIDGALGMVLATAGRHDEAALRFDAAAAQCRRIGAPLLLARVELARAALLPASADEIRARRDRARRTADEHHAAGLGAEIDRFADAVRA